MVGRQSTLSFGVSVQQFSYEEKASASPNEGADRKIFHTEDENASTAAPSPPLKSETSTPKSPIKSWSPASLKRKASTLKTEPSSSSFKRKQSSAGYAPPSKYAHLTNLLTDSLAPDLICVFIGVNPGLRTATAGHAYAHPSNLFWKLLHSSGCTPRPCKPEEDKTLPYLYALGNTNIVTRPTKDASELSAQEMDEGVEVLEEKARRWRPESVCIVGKGIWESIWRVRHKKKITKNEFKYGWQDKKENMGKIKATDTQDGWCGAKVFVATTTSGLAAGMSLDQKEEIWRGLGEWVTLRRKERGIPDEGCAKVDDLKIEEETTVES